MLRLVPAHAEENLVCIRELFIEYAEAIGIDLSFQDFADELANLPGEYVPPDGGVLLALVDGRPAGCVALRSFGEGICEMKRLHVRPAFRGRGIGLELAKAIIDQARTVGYERIRLDTIPSMKPAITLYESLGFKTIKPYRYNPIKSAQFMELVLRR